MMRFSLDFVLVNKMIDSHCHINDPAYINNPEKYIKEATSAGVNKLLVIGYDLKSSKDALEIASKFDNVYAAIGVHPSEVKKAGNNDLKEIEKMLSNPKVIAIGEIGLDYHWDKDLIIRNMQREWFENQIELANKHHLPISIHCREANEDCLNILKKHKPICSGVMHCYSGSPEMVKDFIKIPVMLGIGGVVTFKNGIKLKEVVKIVPEDMYLLETDAPYLAPVPHRGELNHSKYLPLIAEEIARLRREPIDKVIETTDRNFAKLFKI